MNPISPPPAPDRNISLSRGHSPASGLPQQSSPGASSVSSDTPASPSRVGSGSAVPLARRESLFEASAGTAMRERATFRPADRTPPQTQTGNFSQQEQRALREADKVLVLEYSSTGGGHTARSLDPVMVAAKSGTLKRDDCVVVLAPPSWESDRNGGKVNTLHDKADALRNLGLSVIIKQADKTVTGLYQPNGDSDNVRMLKDFVDKPKRNAAQTPLTTERINLENPRVRTGEGSTAKALLDKVIEAVGPEKKQKISVLGDMAPFLQKAAAAAGITQSVEIGNHQGLFVGAARTQLEGKDLAYLHKASGSGHAQKLALVEYTDNVNVVRDLAPTMEALGITEDTSKQDARAKVLDHLLQFGNRVDATPGAKVANGILVGSDVKSADDVKAMVYLYVNDYTQGAVDHIRTQMKDHPDTHGKCLFAVCGAGAVGPKDGESPPANTTNILQLMYAANADGVTNAGFGTTSEYHYMAKNGYAGDFVAFPVVNQHEQEANAAQLVDAFDPGRVTKAIGAQEMYQAVDALVAKRTSQERPDSHLGNDSMRSLFVASRSETSAAGQAADLLASLYAADGEGSAETAGAQAATAAMKDYDDAESAKQHRRVYKLAVPALASIAKGEDTCDIKATSKVDATTVDVSDVARLLTGRETRAGELLREMSFSATPARTNATDQIEGLMNIRIDSDSAKTLARQLGDDLQRILDMPAPARAGAAAEALNKLANERVALGW